MNIHWNTSGYHRHELPNFFVQSGSDFVVSLSSMQVQVQWHKIGHQNHQTVMQREQCILQSASNNDWYPAYPAY
jgi:hypothetical protein